MTEGVSDAGLVRAALEGDQVAFGELVRRYRDAAFGVAFHRLGDFEAARDVAQEALVTAYVELPMLRDPAKFGHWLYRIARMAALAELRRRRPSLSLDLPGMDLQALPESDPAESLERAEKAREVREALALLPEPDRLAVILHYVNGYSHEEIGGILGTTVSAVKSRVHRARRRLREEMLQMVESNLKSEAVPIEFTEDLARAALDRYPEHQVAILDRRWVPFPLAFTGRSRDAIARIASELAAEGYRWLVGPPHLPDGSPALGLLQEMGFQVETEMHWYERSLKGRLPAVPAPEAGLTTRPLAGAGSDALAAVMQASLPQGSPGRFTPDDVRRTLEADATVTEASLALYKGDRLASFLLVLANREGNAKFEADTAVVWWAFRDPAVVPPEALRYLLLSVLRPLKDAGFARVVKELLHPDWEYDRELIAILKRAGFRYVRSQWNLKLDLAAWQSAGGQRQASTPSAIPSEPVRVMRPLAFSQAECPVDARHAEALQVRVGRVLGTAPVVAPGEAYIASGEYTLSEPVIPRMALACNGTSRGNQVHLTPGTHAFDAPCEALQVNPGKGDPPRPEPDGRGSGRHHTGKDDPRGLGIRTLRAGIAAWDWPCHATREPRQHATDSAPDPPRPVTLSLRGEGSPRRVRRSLPDCGCSPPGCPTHLGSKCERGAETLRSAQHDRLRRRCVAALCLTGFGGDASLPSA